MAGERVVDVVKAQIETLNLRARSVKRQRGIVADALACAGHPDLFTAKVEALVHYAGSRDSSAHQPSIVGFFARLTKSISPCA